MMPYLCCRFDAEGKKSALNLTNKANQTQSMVSDTQSSIMNQSIDSKRILGKVHKMWLAKLQPILHKMYISYIKAILQRQILYI